MQNEKTIKIYCDGGARGNPGPAASAFVVFTKDKEVLHTEAKTLGTSTNNVAEYTAVLLSLEWLEKNETVAKTEDFYLDSLLVVNQLNGLFKIKNTTLLEIARRIKTKISVFPGTITFQHIRREKNTHADSLVNRALDELS